MHNTHIHTTCMQRDASDKLSMWCRRQWSVKEIPGPHAAWPRMPWCNHLVHVKDSPTMKQTRLRIAILDCQACSSHLSVPAEAQPPSPTHALEPLPLTHNAARPSHAMPLPSCHEAQQAARICAMVCQARCICVAEPCGSAAVGLLRCHMPRPLLIWMPPAATPAPVLPRGPRGPFCPGLHIAAKRRLKWPPAYFRGMKREDLVEPRPDRPCFTGL